MKFVRPLMEIEAMPMRDTEGNVVSYCCDLGDGKGTPIYTAAELERLGFRMLNGHTPGKPRTRRKANYRSSAEAPDLSGEEAKREKMFGGEQWSEEERAQIQKASEEQPIRGAAQRLVDEIRKDFQVEPAQEYDHQ